MSRTRVYILGIILLLLALLPVQASGRYTIHQQGFQVELAEGNLALTANSFSWTFETDNTPLGSADVLGGAPANTIDLFGWSGSMYRYWGVSAMPGATVYQGDFIDWGTNSISGSEPGEWCTLTADEWAYILNSRYNAAQLRGYATIDGQYGLVLLRDSSDLTIQPSYTASEWAAVVADGAVFLPIAGERDGGLNVDMTQGLYWTATPDGADNAKCLVLGSEAPAIASKFRAKGAAVRLAKRVLLTVLVEPTDCEEFDHWSDDPNNTDNPRTFTYGETDIVPIMRNKKFTIIGAVNDASGGSVTVTIQQ
ncbi:MAG: hypothetical protein IJR74_01870 [Paludibacteraceae bacterium]|nr:hypothetical protein [Paludibacteraceae bacterium]